MLDFLTPFCYLSPHPSDGGKEGGLMGVFVMTDFGDRLKTLREAAGLSQEALARAAGISTSAVAKLEQKRVEPSWPTVLELAKALGVGVEAFTTEPPLGQPKKGKKR
jgi:DNA-binding XRE family transcriptional regulator